jgi:two-component system chemotaxis response regulator CheY
MNILIVDDIEDNRHMLERLITQFSRKYEVDVNVFQAENGKIGVDICNEKTIDLVFMDIIMPVMDGLEATKIIKKEHPAAMVIVISSENDEAIKTEILQAGAEDYVLKPFSSAIMLSRLNNYSKLIRSRNAIGFQTKAVNTFTHNVYSYQLTFSLSNEDELAQFWETMLVRLEFQNHITQLSDFVRFMFRLGTFQLQKAYKCHVYVEEDEHNFYFTMDNMRLISVDTVRQMIEKYCSHAIYEIKGDLVSFLLPRIDENSLPMAPEENIQAEEELTSVSSFPSVSMLKETLQTYDILDIDALEEFDYIVSKLQTEIMMMGSSSLEMDDIDTMNEYIKKLASILSVSQDSYAISASLSDFSALLDEYSEPFLAMSKDLSTMMVSFINDLLMWKER